MKRRRSRVGIGILMIFAGVANIAGSGGNPPVGGIEAATYYVVTFALFVAGLWLIFRKGRKPSDASTANGGE